MFYLLIYGLFCLFIINLLTKEIYYTEMSHKNKNTRSNSCEVIEVSRDQVPTYTPTRDQKRGKDKFTLDISQITGESKSKPAASQYSEGSKSKPATSQYSEGSKSKPVTSQTSEGSPNVEPQELSKVRNSEILSHRYYGEQERELSLVRLNEPSSRRYYSEQERELSIVRTLPRRYYREQGRELSLVRLNEPSSRRNHDEYESLIKGNTYFNVFLTNIY